MRLKQTFALLTLIALGTSTASAEPPAPPPIKVGVLLPLSGRYASAGQSNRRGIELVVNKTNLGGGIASLHGAKIQLVFADDASNQETASQEARRLMTTENVAFILGPYSTPETQAVVPVTERGGVGLISTQGSFDGMFTHGYKGLFTVSMTSSQFGESYDTFLKTLASVHKAAIKTVAITYPNNDYGQTAAQAAQARLKARGINVVGTFEFPPTVTDLTPIVQRVKELKPDAVISIGYLEDGLLLDKARVAQNATGPLVWVGGSDSFSNDRLWSLLGDGVAKVALGGHTFGLSQFDNTVRTPGVEWLVRSTRVAYPGAIVDQGMAAGAQAAWILVEALERSGKTSPADLIAAVHAVHLPANSIRTTMPQFVHGVAFAADGRPRDPVALFVHWDNGRKSVVSPDQLATAKVPW
ncbi:MAG: hypothetical protein JWN27_1754 [Candidatus Eremiobacteraeota bacterium]|nr:hypothetical protein [Candidatus Eremiobacteraeota bacterium]